MAQCLPTKQCMHALLPLSTCLGGRSSLYRHGCAVMLWLTPWRKLAVCTGLSAACIGAAQAAFDV